MSLDLESKMTVTLTRGEFIDISAALVAVAKLDNNEGRPQMSEKMMCIRDKVIEQMKEWNN